MASKKNIAERGRAVAAARSRDHDAALLETLGRELLELSKGLRPGDARAPTIEEARRRGLVARRVLAAMTDERPAHGIEETKARRRELLVDLCNGAGRMAPLPNGIPADVSAKLVAREYGEREPLDRELVQRNVEHVRSLIEAHAKNKGGSGNKGKAAVDAALENLCDHMGYPANRATIRRTAHRRSKRSGARPKG